jgi:hypothetical protein
MPRRERSCSESAECRHSTSRTATVAAAAAQFLAETPAEAEPISRWLAERDRTLEAGAGGELVLWFEADLYDQLQLVQVLARLAQLGVEPSRVTLICIGEHLGMAHAGGLGELTPRSSSALPEPPPSP